MNFINKVNKYLLEQYPLIWNTRLVWMIAANLLVHSLFFILGFTTVNNVQDLKNYYSLSNFFFESSAVYYNFLISIVIILIWIIYYLRNNAFKNLYNLPKGFLFKQFCIILVIIFISITQYFSYRQGLVAKIKLNYDWEEVDKDIKAFNKTGIFLLRNQSDYEIKNKKYPKPFPLEIAYSSKIKHVNNSNSFDNEADDYDGNLVKNNIDVTKPYIVRNKLFYQFYRFNEDLWQHDLEKTPDLYEYKKNDFRYRIVEDVSEFKELIHPSLLNYSNKLFYSGQDSLAYTQQLKSHQQILENGDETEIKGALTTFIKLAKKYKINHNLDVETWFKYIYNTPFYKVNILFNQSPPSLHNTNFSNTKSRYYDDISYSENLYISIGNTDNVFKNIYEAYFKSIEQGLVYFLIGFAYCLALLLFIFKTTNIRNVLLSIVASILLLIIIIWLMSSIKFLNLDSDYHIYLIMLFVSFMVILFSIISYKFDWSRILVYILWSINLFALPLFILFSCLIYIKEKNIKHLEMYPKDYSYKSSFEIWFNNYGFWLVLVSSFIAVYIYSNYIRKLRARAE